MLHISLAAETLFTLYGLKITNALLSTWIVMGILTLVAFAASQSLKLKPSTFQVIIEDVVGGLHGFLKEILHDKVDRFFPLLATMFLLIIVSNWSGLLPGVGSIGLRETETPHAVVSTETQNVEEVARIDEHEVEAQVEVLPAEEHAVTEDAAPEAHTKFIPVFRAPSADLNLTLALALISFFSIQITGLQFLGLAYFKKFLNFSNPIMFFVGILETVSEFSKIVSFAFRLFGNIFAGEVLLGVISFLIPYIAPIPFLGLELFVGFIQALVFAMLTAVFLSMATEHH